RLSRPPRPFLDPRPLGVPFVRGRPRPARPGARPLVRAGARTLPALRREGVLALPHHRAVVRTLGGAPVPPRGDQLEPPLPGALGLSPGGALLDRPRRTAP